MKKVFFLPAMLLLLAAGCSDDDDKNNNELIPISLDSRLVVEPRASRQDTQIAEDQQVSLFVTRTGEPASSVYNNARLTADGLGNFSYLYDGQTVLYYPIDDVNVDFYAIHPYSVTNNTLTADLNFRINEDQSQIGNFLDSDLLYSKREDISKGRDAVQLRFNHKLSKLSFIIHQGVGVDLSQLSAIRVLNVQAGVNMDQENGSLTSVTNTAVTVTPYGLEEATISENKLEGISAIIVPQTITTGTRLFQFTVGGTEFYYTVPQDVTFVTETSYRYSITINNAGIVVTSSIAPWTTTEDTEGEGTID